MAWLTPALLIAKCPMNIKYFPFDEQECVFEFGSWTYDGSQLDVNVRDMEISLSKKIFQNFQTNVEYSRLHE